MVLFLYGQRHKLVKLFEAWCKENNVDENDRTNLITWLHMNGLLDMENVEKILNGKGE